MPALDATGAIVGYGVATVTGGTSPLTGPTCSPLAGSKFGIGTTTVTCTVTDAKARAGSCLFNVVVQSPPKLTLTRFLAFGDSITAGEIPSEGIGPQLIDPYLNYASDLNRLLAIQYQTQQAGVDNEGVQGEITSTGLSRLPRVIGNGNNYQVLLLMEGANDIPGGASAVSPAASNVLSMIHVAKGSGLRVLLANLPPENPDACRGSNSFPGCIARAGGAPFVVQYNDFMRSIATQESVPFVDVYAAFNGDVKTLIDFDGLHPTAAGYTAIAQTFFKVIQQNFEQPAAASASTLRLPFFAAPRRR